ncbi:MAG: tRNA (adenosine(37)-N6)-dimethylallyltransferase MiaA [Elusimicrobia bacterium]|nr:tRNA (adenosine(37)-N6)-dimethylallyltransferase MiaA [Elusimicrobiota bacterium]
MQKPIVIMGASASGKTELAVEISKKIDGEIISVDSRQVFKYLSAGTAKPEGRWTETGGTDLYLVDGIPYHLVDFLDPKFNYDAGRFVDDAKTAMKEVSSRGKTPVFAGGAGLYIQALWNGLDPLPKADQGVREDLREFAEKFGRDALHSRLKEMDPEAAMKIPPDNIQRVIRAIEVTRLTGIPISKLWSGCFFNALPNHLALFALILWKKHDLAERIKKRTTDNFEKWAEETRKILNEGYPEDCPGLKSLGYPQIIDYVSGNISKPEAIRKITTLTNTYAKRQITWFSRYKNILKVEIDKPSDWDPDKIFKTILAYQN